MTSSTPASEGEPAVFDASPLVFFDVLGYAGRLPELHRVFVPPAVIEELVALPGEPGSGLPAEGWVERQAPRAETLRKVEGEMTEGRGEKEAIALALDLSAGCARRQASKELRPAGGGSADRHIRRFA